MNENDNGTSNLTGFVVGTLVGAGIALLLAPGSGKDTRQWLARKTRELKGKTEDAYEETKATLRHEAEGLVGEAKDAVKGYVMSPSTSSVDKHRG